MKKLTVRVPASSANLGPGFDCLGIAFQVYNWFTFSWEKIDETFTLKNQEDCLSKTSIAQMPMHEAYVKYGELFDIELPLLANVKSIRSDVPLARGLGSSATCYIAGARAAQYVAEELYTKNEIMDNLDEYKIDPFSKEAVLAVAAAIEKHPDNLSPAVFGGLQISTIEKAEGLPKVLNQALSIHKDMRFIISYPDFSLRTKESRAVLPSKILHEDAVFNLRAITFLLEGIKHADQKLLEYGLRDRIHQPYRAGLIPKFYEILETSKRLGAAGSVLSGAGPGILTITTDKNQNSHKLAEEIQKKLGDSWKVFNLEIDHHGLISYLGDEIIS